MARIDTCGHFLVKGKCAESIIDRFKGDDFIPGHEEIGATDVEPMDQICAECPNYIPKTDRHPKSDD